MKRLELDPQRPMIETRAGDVIVKRPAPPIGPIEAQFVSDFGSDINIMIGITHPLYKELVGKMATIILEKKGPQND